MYSVQDGLERISLSQRERLPIPFVRLESTMEINKLFRSFAFRVTSAPANA